MTDGANQVVSIAPHRRAVGISPLVDGAWGALEEVKRPTQGYLAGGAVNSAGDVLVVWDLHDVLEGAIFADGTWTPIPALTPEGPYVDVHHVRLFDDGRAVVVTSASEGIPPSSALQVHTLDDGAWSTTTVHPSAGHELSAAQAATTPGGDLLVWWAEHAPSLPAGDRTSEVAGRGATLYAAVQLAGEDALGEPRVISTKPSCVTYETCSAGVPRCGWSSTHVRPERRQGASPPEPAI